MSLPEMVIQIFGLIVVNTKTFLTWKLWNQKQRRICLASLFSENPKHGDTTTVNQMLLEIKIIYIHTKTLTAFQQKGGLVYFALK